MRSKSDETIQNQGRKGKSKIRKLRGGHPVRESSVLKGVMARGRRIDEADSTQTARRRGKEIPTGSWLCRAHLLILEKRERQNER